MLAHICQVLFVYDYQKVTFYPLDACIARSLPRQRVRPSVTAGIV